MRFADLDAVTLDANGTILRLTDPVQALAELVRRHGVDRSHEDVAHAFAAEVAYYRPRALEGRDAASLADLRRRCADVFLEALGAEGGRPGFAGEFLAALRFEPIPDISASLTAMRRGGLRLAVVSNWDVGLPDHLAAAGLGELFAEVVTSAEAGAEKPDPRIFRLTLDRLSVRPERALHIGDEAIDEEGALAAGMHFAPAPVADAVAALA